MKKIIYVAVFLAYTIAVAAIARSIKPQDVKPKATASYYSAESKEEYFDAGYETGYETGYDEGLKEGLTNFKDHDIYYNEMYSEAYKDGYSDCANGVESQW